MDNNWRSYVVELVGTFMFVLLASGAVCTSYLPADQSGKVYPDLTAMALAQGFALAALLGVTPRFSEGCLNPAITLALWVFKRLELRKLGGLLAAQLLGSFLAGLVLWLSFWEIVLRDARLGAPHLNAKAFGLPDASFASALLSGIGFELLLSFIVTLVIFATLLDPRAPRFGGLAAGLALSAVIFMGYYLTGAAVNPARWFGPALCERFLLGMPDALDDHIIYWLGPILGALAAGGLYTFCMMPADVESTESAAIKPRERK
ncbi:MAG: aquaporin [Gemmataceae bacterium]